MAGYWRGAIQTREQAERIAKTTSLWFGGFVGLATALLAINGRLDASSLISILVIFVPALWLWFQKSPIAAGWLVGLSAFAVLMSVTTAAYSMKLSNGLGPGIIVVALIWLVPLLASLRALSAARYLRKNPEVPVAMAFE